MEAQLEQLIQQAQQADVAAAERSQVIAAIAEILLRSRKIGRPPAGQPLTEIYQELCERLRQQLLQDLPPALKTYSQALPAREWATALQHQAARKILDDNQLKQIALEAQNHPPQSALRRHALMQLVEAIRLSGRLARPHRGKFSPQFYDLLHEEAVNKTLAYLCRHIDSYDPARGQAQKFMNWVNFRLDRTLIECRREFSDRNTTALPNLNDLETLPQPETAPSLADNVHDYIRADPDGDFQATHVRNRPDASFQTIALARLMGKSWEEISADLGIKIPTLSSFFQRCCDKFSAKFQELL
ncbi:hypothetical protein [Pseudanabaena sp. FACHB-2040]|uniref:hypothetical protein n=1 Tax=Pseudanabaena sp. FACHB-2040 TaxID=2692859 RepID=UPI0016859A8C|nr:hypothetical protein [Pseudanabaena sp. FACHB-2040]MBD2259392.1 hypothetical protein [Pseudanabaena sp. FACHB-2040]